MSKTERRQTEKSSNDVFARLAAPFPPEAVRFKPQTVQGNRALAVAYLDVRSIMDRLDEVVGPEGWQDEYEPMPDGCVKGTLALSIGGQWVRKSDAGSRSDQADEGDQQKAAFTDALKRAAVKWGIGRYLYRLPKQWVGYDPDRKQFTEPPKLPAWALPNGKATSEPDRTPEVAEQPGDGNGTSKETAVPTGQRNGHLSTGRQLFQWLKQQERGLVADQLARPGELVEHVAKAGADAGHGDRIVQWDANATALGLRTAGSFIARRKGEPAPFTPRRNGTAAPSVA